ncbi:DNA replication complex GINS protein PSF1 [Candida viswanathii]|uniref:DNA replication complex GINS protein PSF1 n=1 Tax=Candida viswanathii TaxID=5486 RepID=A0A367YI69_9ASCO|nr:DNA replication complex GINS protein PSF1 [Candida viswanathii]
MYGDTANKLILDAKRSSNLSSIPIYQSDLIRDIVKETNDLNKDVDYLTGVHDEITDQLNVLTEQYNESIEKLQDINRQRLELDKKLKEIEKKERDPRNTRDFSSERSEITAMETVLLKRKENTAELVQDLSKDIEQINEKHSKINQCQLFVTHLSMRRNKRCLLAYEKLRADKIAEFAWLNIDPVEGTPSSTTMESNVTPITKNLTNYTTSLDLNNLNHFEQDFFKQYQDLIMNFKSDFEDIDLSGDLNAPTNIFIDVRVLKDGGEVTTEYGSFNLIKDSQFFVRKSDVERLIQQGYLEEIV